MFRIFQNHNLDLFSLYTFRTIGLVLTVHKATLDVPTNTIYEINMCKSQYKKDFQKRRGLMEGYFWADKRTTSQQW